MFAPKLRFLALLPLLVLSLPAAAVACPFCNAQTKTLSEEIDSSDVVIIAKLVKGPPIEAVIAGSADAEATFEIVQILKGGDALEKNSALIGLAPDSPKRPRQSRQIRVLYFGQQPVGTEFLVFGVDPKKVQWTTPNALSPRAVKYVSQLVGLPKSGADRLTFFQEYLEDDESLLATDAYDEFARAPYAEVKQLKPRMHREQLLKWIKNRDVPASRRRLYLTMLGVCGQADDLAVLEQMIQSSDRQVRTALDAMVACYLILKGPDGMPLIEDLFLKNKDAEYTDTYAAIMAVRFLGQETTAVPKERLLAGLRAMLDRPQLADLVIPDLARWQDWSAMKKLVELFKNADEESSWVKVPVVNYLRACPKPEAKAYLAELAKLDPESVKRANSFFPFGAAAPAVPADKATAKQPQVPAPDKSGGAASDAKPAKANGSSGSKSDKGPKPGQSSSNDRAVVVPALIGAVVAMAEQTAAPEESAERPAVQQDPTTTTLDNAEVANPEAASDGESRQTAQAAPPGMVPATSRRVREPEANRWQVAFVTLGAAGALFGLMFTILRRN
ncbi:MAG TPA: hypothetical protein PK867_14805 [Pirellulales bacterium]|nr:hypothetical protein [Pirellulales bacterium]